ncbi:hypothetical protein J6590_032605 [Homalodisca vitripennis]|nr:hypothetical protein J6590_032605 [Homalodisca vitripennis]
MVDCSCPVSLPGPSVANSCGGASFVLFMGLLEQFLRSQCDIEDPCGHFTPPQNPEREYDFIVVGGGSGGSVVASRLSEVPDWNVLLVEAGGNEPTGSQVPSLFLNFLGSSVDWKYKTQPEEMACLNSKDQRCSWPRGKQLWAGPNHFQNFGRESIGVGSICRCHGPIQLRLNEEGNLPGVVYPRIP